MFIDLVIYDFIWFVYCEVIFFFLEEVIDLFIWGDFKYLIIENKVFYINIYWGELNFVVGFLLERDSV